MVRAPAAPGGRALCPSRRGAGAPTRRRRGGMVMEAVGGGPPGRRRWRWTCNLIGVTRLVSDFSADWGTGKSQEKENSNFFLTTTFAKLYFFFAIGTGKKYIGVLCNSDIIPYTCGMKTISLDSTI